MSTPIIENKRTSPIRAYRIERRLALSLQRDSLLRSKANAVCFWVLMAGGLLLAVGCVSNAYTVGTPYDAITYIGMIGGIVLGTLAVIAAAATTLVTLTYEGIRMVRVLVPAWRNRNKCAICALGMQHN